LGVLPVGSLRALAVACVSVSDRRAQSLGDRTLVELGRLHEAAAAHVRIVQEYIDAHLNEPLTAGQLAALVGTSVRGLQLQFHRLVGCSPIAFVRRRRLEAVRRDPLQGPPGDTVSQIAFRWGLCHLGRFAGDYLRLFGEHPW
jgi:transcriptional regulator GlxA family with amidase domain